MNGPARQIDHAPNAAIAQEAEAMEEARNPGVLYVDLRPYMDIAPVTVRQALRLYLLHIPSCSFLTIQPFIYSRQICLYSEELSISAEDNCYS